MQTHRWIENEQFTAMGLFRFLCILKSTSCHGSYIHIFLKLYDTYKESGPAFPIVISALSMNAVAIPGMVFNLFLVYTTCVNK